MFDVIFLVMTPLTQPASEFHRTRSPTLNPFRHRGNQVWDKSVSLHPVDPALHRTYAL